MSLPLAAANLGATLFWAVFLGWIATVAVHEFAHGLVAHLGGDYTIRERGGLTLNPLRYVDPVMSIALPALFMLMGGVPLPGGATYVRTDLLRNNAWRTAVSLAGPASNFLILVLLLVILHPKLGLFDASVPASQWSDLHLFVGALALLQAISIVLNLLPVPPLDGFNAIAPYLPPVVVTTLRTPPVPYVCLFAFYFLIGRPFYDHTYGGLDVLCSAMGMNMDGDMTTELVHAARIALYGNT